ncbi:MAG: MFS transporter [Thermoplasmata archaeon]
MIKNNQNQKDLKRIYASSILTGIPMGFNFVAFPIYLSLVGYNSFEIGLVIAVGTLVGAIFMIPFGVLSDKFGRLKFIITARVLSAVSFLMLIFSYNIVIVYASNIIQGIAFANIGSSFSALMSEKSTIENRNFVFSRNTFFSGVSMAGGMVLSNFPNYLINLKFGVFPSFRYMFILFFLIQIVSIILFLGISEDYVPIKRRGISKETMRTVWKLGVLGMIGLGAGIIVRLFSLWFYLKFGLNIGTIGNFFAISQFLTALANLFSARLASLMGTIKSIVTTEALSVVILVLIPLSISPSMAIVLYITRSLLMNMSSPVMTAFTMSIIRKEERATAASIIQLFDSAPRSFGPAIGGYFYSIGDLDLPFYITAFLYSISITFFFILFRKTRLQNEKD